MTMTATLALDQLAAAVSAALTAPVAPPPAEPPPDPAPAEWSPQLSFPPALDANPTLAEALHAALNKLHPGDSEKAKERRKKILDAITEELGELVIYGVDVHGARIPVDFIELGNASIEVDANGDAVRIVVDAGDPIWDPE